MAKNRMMTGMVRITEPAMRTVVGTSMEPARRDRPSETVHGKPGVMLRSWQHGRLYTNDPDCAVLRPQFARREEWLDVVTRAGGLRSVSDRLKNLDDWGLAATRALLDDQPPAQPLPGGIVTLEVPA